MSRFARDTFVHMNVSAVLDACRCSPSFGCAPPKGLVHFFQLTSLSTHFSLSQTNEIKVFLVDNSFFRPARSTISAVEARIAFAAATAVGRCHCSSISSTSAIILLINFEGEAKDRLPRMASVRPIVAKC